MASVQKVTPCLWFNGNAKEAVDYYAAVFPGGKIVETAYYPTEGLLDFQKALAGQVLTIDFELAGQRFTALNAGPEFVFNESVSFVVGCKDQEEIDYFWERLSKVPEAEQCGWCKDQFGLSWQIVPADMGTYMNHPGAFAKLLQMKKIVVADFDQ